jgi:hypothetical protein
MNKRISYWKKYKLFNNFKKTIKENKETLQKNYNLRIDNAYRLYTVLNIPEEIIGESYSLKKSDIDRISENFIKEYGSELAIFLNSKGLNELYEYYEIKKVDKYSYLLVYGFSLFKSHKFYNNLYWRAIPIASLIASILLFLIIL